MHLNLRIYFYSEALNLPNVTYAPTRKIMYVFKENAFGNYLIFVVGHKRKFFGYKRLKNSSISHWTHFRLVEFEKYPERK